ncbi:uncharacterized protein PAC_18445 [Phialocephala subalpina]|uniref:Uncharacterized protein n=1 Tax=Phialocephala subalpina TaxID=576137 RepID=A0A1L7XU39_9HELO|nr:uncharacterized protein PAC_18445 [Phialocephala subalpina]
MPGLGRNIAIFILGIVAALCFSTVFQTRAKDWPGYFEEVNVGLRQFWWRVRYAHQAEGDEWDRVIGIELGRTFSRVGIFRNNTFELIHDEQNRSVVPSYVAFTNDGPPLVGYAALEQAAKNPENTIYDVNLLIGRKLMDPKVLTAIKTFPYHVVGNDDRPAISIQGDIDVNYTHSEISAMVITKLKTMAEAHLNEPVSLAIISVPDDFNDDQRQATRDAARIAGLDAIRLVSESTAAGIGYGLDIPKDPYGSKVDSEYFVIYHLDAKESKLALLSVDCGVFETLALANDESLGGYVFENDWNDDIRLKDAAVDLVRQLLDGAKLATTEVDGLVFTGNPAHVVSIKYAVERYLGEMKARSFEYPSKDPVSSDEAIVRGVARQASIMGPPEDGYVSTMEVTPLDYGIEMSQGVFARVMKRNFVIPTRKARTFVTTVDDQERMVIPILEGFRAIASKNRLLGTLELTNLPKKPRGEVEIEVSFEIDANYVLTVFAKEKEKESGREAKLRIPPDWAEYYGDDGIEKLMEEAKEHHKEELRFLQGVSYVEPEEKGDDGFLVMPKGGRMDFDVALGA